MELTELQQKELNKTHYLIIEDSKAVKLQDERRIVHFISTPELDRGADIMMPKGMNADKFEGTKTVFFNHNYDLPIGKNVKLVATNDGVKATTYFTDKTQIANDVYQLHLDGVLNSWSIGFKPIMDSRTGMVKPGTVEWVGETNIRKFLEWELLEYSSTGIPMNAGALDIAKSIVKSNELRKEISFQSEIVSLKSILETREKDFNDLKVLFEELKNGNNLEEIKNEISEIKTKLENAGKANVQTPLFSAEEIKGIVKSSIVGVFSEFTGRKYKI